MMGESSERYLTTRSIIRCTHGGTLKIPDVVTLCQIASGPILTTNAVSTGIFVGCSQVGPGVKPCLKVNQITRGISAMFQVSGLAAVTDKLDFVTDGTPPGQRLIDAPNE